MLNIWYSGQFGNDSVIVVSLGGFWDFRASKCHNFKKLDYSLTQWLWFEKPLQIDLESKL